MLQTLPPPANVKSDPAYVRPHIEPPLTGRQLQIERLLIQYRDLVEAASPTDGGTGHHVPLRPHAPNCRIHRATPPRCTCHQRSVAELERLLALMRTTRRNPWWHLTERYFRSPQTIKPMRVRRRDQRGRTLTVIEPQIVIVLPPTVQLQQVRLAIGWLATQWNLDVEPMLPPNEAIEPLAAY